MFSRSLLASLLTLAILGAQALPAQAAQPLEVEVYNPGDKAIFPVSSEIVLGTTDAVLIDAQFQRNDAQALVSKLQNSGRKLTTVYISHSDPDYYFGLAEIQAAFPDAKIVASAPTVAAIKASMDGKLAYWGPILKDQAPTRLVLPAVLVGDRITLDGQMLKIKGLKSASPQRSYVWIPSLKTVVGGVVVSSGIHVWVADTQTRKSRHDWQTTLKGMAALKPLAVVPGHYLGDTPVGLGAVTFTAGYLKAFDAQAVRAKDSAALIAAMKSAYPQLGDVESLELSAKVVKGEMHWPQ